MLAEQVLREGNASFTPEQEKQTLLEVFSSIADALLVHRHECQVPVSIMKVRFIWKLSFDARHQSSFFRLHMHRSHRRAIVPRPMRYRASEGQSGV